MKCQRKQLKKHTKLKFSGELTIAHAEQMKTALAETLEQANQVVLDIKDVTEMDLSALQLICSAHRTAMSAEKQIRFAAQPTGELDHTRFLSGFVREIGCDHKAEGSCLWSGGGS